MNRFAIVAAACAVAYGITAPAGAATIVQTDSENLNRGIAKFNPMLGLLDAVTIDADITKYSTNYLRVPVGTEAGTYHISWVVDGLWLGPVGSLTMTGTGSFDVVVPATTPYATSFLFYVPAHGSGSTTITGDVTRYVNYPGSNPTIYLDGYYTGIAENNDTTYSGLLPGWDVFRMAPTFGEDSNGNSLYKVTYDYTPTSALPAPEPAAWALMLLGFGGVGYALRRRPAARIRFV